MTDGRKKNLETFLSYKESSIAIIWKVTNTKTLVSEWLKDNQVKRNTHFIEARNKNTKKSGHQARGGGGKALVAGQQKK